VGPYLRRAALQVIQGLHNQVMVTEVKSRTAALRRLVVKASHLSRPGES